MGPDQVRQNKPKMIFRLSWDDLWMKNSKLQSNLDVEKDVKNPALKDELGIWVINILNKTISIRARYVASNAAELWLVKM